MAILDTRPKWLNAQVLLTKISKREMPVETSVLLAAPLAALAPSACDDGSLDSGDTSPTIYNEYGKTLAASVEGVNTATKEMMQKPFDRAKGALRNLSAGQHDATYSEPLKALKNERAGVTEDKTEEAKEAVEEAKSTTANTKEDI